MSSSRTAAVARLRAWLAASHDPLTVWGMPGIGKSFLVRSELPEGWQIHDARDPSIPLPTVGPVVWDGASAATARAALIQGVDGPVLITCRERLDLEAEVSIEIGPLDVDEGAALLEAELGKRGHALELADRVAVVRALSGVPLAVVRAARWFDVIGLDGLLAADGVNWTGPMDAAPHLESLRTALLDDWQALSADHQVALIKLSPVGGTITPALAEHLLGATALESLRRLRDRSWLRAASPGSMCMLSVVRSFVSSLAPPADLSRAHTALGEVLLHRAAVAWPALDRDGAPIGELGLWLDELERAVAAAVTTEADHPGLVEAISLLAVLRPGSDGFAAIDRMLEQVGTSPDLARAASRLAQATGQSQRAVRELERALQSATEPRTAGVLERELGVLAHRQRKIKLANAHYQRALALSGVARDERSTAIAEANLAALSHDAGQLEEASEGYNHALDTLQGLGDARLEGIFLSNIGALEIERGRMDDAADALKRAVALLRETPDHRMLAIALGNLGWLAFVQGRPAEAERSLEESLRSLPTGSDVRTQALAEARLAAIRAGEARVDEARAGLQRAARVLAGTEDRLTRRVVELFAGFVDLAAGSRTDALARLDAARSPQGDTPALVAVSDDARSAVRVLEGLILRDPGPALCVGEASVWVRVPGGEQVSLERFGTARRLLDALVQARLDTPGVGLSLDQLFAAGWPEEQIGPESARNRVHVALNKLRGAGLKPYLIRSDAGYLLDMAVPLLAVGG